MVDTLATAADYADAMMTARKAKNALFFLLLLILLIQLAVFIVGAFTDALFPTSNETIPAASVHAEAAAPSTAPATAPVSVSTGRGAVQVSASSSLLRDGLRYLTGLCDFLGVGLSIVLAMVLLIITGIMLVGRLIGVSRVTSALIWSLILIVLLFPWQAFLDRITFKIPGVLYTWDELVRDVHFMSDSSRSMAELVLKWARFIGFPVLALLILSAVQVKSRRGIQQALGEAVVDTRTMP
jgi:hypothetical protein